MGTAGINYVREIQGREGSTNDTFRRTYTRRFRVSVKSLDVGPEQIRFAVDPATAVTIPQIWDVYQGYLYSPIGNVGDFDRNALCVSVKVKETEDPFLFEVDCEFDTDVTEESQEAENPLDEPAELLWDTEDYQQAIDQDINGNPIINSALDQYDPPLESEQSHSTLTVNRNELWFDEQRARQYRNKLNSDIFQGYLPGLAKCKKIAAQRQYRNGQVFWRVTYHFVFNESGWNARPLDAGYRELTGRNPATYANITVGGQAVSQPVALDGNGRKLDLSAAGAVAVYNDFDLYLSIAFAGLAIPVATAPEQIPAPADAGEVFN